MLEDGERQHLISAFVGDELFVRPHLESPSALFHYQKINIDTGYR